MVIRAGAVASSNFSSSSRALCNMALGFRQAGGKQNPSRVALGRKIRQKTVYPGDRAGADLALI